MEQNIRKGIAFALLAAALYAVNAPFSKLLLSFMPATLMAGFLYIGAGLGMLLLALIRKMEKSQKKESGLPDSFFVRDVQSAVIGITSQLIQQPG